MREVPFFVTETKTENPAVRVRRRKKSKPKEGYVGVPRYSISLVREAGSIYVTSSPISTGQMLYLQMQELLADEDREAFYVVCLDMGSKVIGVNLVSVGTLNASLVHPREVLKVAILLNSASIICVHNHPSGRVSPSTQDRELTERLAEAGRLLGIKVADHLIVSNEGFFSFYEQGYL